MKDTKQINNSLKQKENNIKTILTWNYNPYKIEEDIFSQPISDKEKELARKIFNKKDC